MGSPQTDAMDKEKPDLAAELSTLQLEDEDEVNSFWDDFDFDNDSDELCSAYSLVSRIIEDAPKVEKIFILLKNYSAFQKFTIGAGCLCLAPSANSPQFSDFACPPSCEELLSQFWSRGVGDGMAFKSLTKSLSDLSVYQTIQFLDRSRFILDHLVATFENSLVMLDDEDNFRDCKKMKELCRREMDSGGQEKNEELIERLYCYWSIKSCLARGVGDTVKEVLKDAQEAWAKILELCDRAEQDRANLSYYRRLIETTLASCIDKMDKDTFEHLMRKYYDIAVYESTAELRNHHQVLLDIVSLGDSVDEWA